MQSIRLASVMLLLAAGCASSAPAERQTPEPPTPPAWTKDLGSRTLEALIVRGLEANPSLREADASLEAMRAIGEAAEASTDVSVMLEGDLNRGRINGTSFGFKGFPSRTLTRYSFGGSASYDLDLFGETDAVRAGASARIDAEAYRLDAARLMLAAEIAARAVDLAGARAEREMLQRILEGGTTTLNLVERSISAGASGEIDRTRVRSLIAQDEALLPGLLGREASARHALAMLTGAQARPGEGPDLSLVDFSALTHVPVEATGDVLRARPDIRAAEAALMAADADRALRASALYPRIRIGARSVQTALNLEDLFGYSATGWSFGPSLTLPVFNRKVLHADVRRAEADIDKADARLQAAVLRAFAEAADALSAIETAQEDLRRQERARDLAVETLRLERKTYELGAGQLPEVITAQRLAAFAEIAVIRAKTQRLRSYIRYFAATNSSLAAAGSAGSARTRAPD